MVMGFIYKISFFTFIIMIQGPIRSTQTLFHGIYSASLADNLPYFIFDRFVRWQV